MQKAAGKLKAVNAFKRGNEIEEEKKQAPKQKGRGYNELLEENSGERMISEAADEENQLLKDDIIDDTLF